MTRPAAAVWLTAAMTAVVALCSCGGDGTSSPTASPGPTVAGPKGPVSIATFTGNTAEITSTFRVDAPNWTIQYSTASENCTTASILILAFDASHPDAFVRNLPLTGCASGTANVPFGPSSFYLKISVSSPQVSYSIGVSEVR